MEASSNSIGNAIVQKQDILQKLK